MGLRRVLLASLVLVVLGQQARALPADVAGALAQLSAASAAERAAAERELARALVIADVPLLAAAVRAGSAEVRSRIASALMSDSRHLALAAELAASSDADVARTGAEALAGQAAAWLGSSDQEPLPLPDIEREVRGAFSGFWRLDVSRGELEDQLDQIARLVDGSRSDRPGAPAPALVLDPDFDARRAKPLAGSEDLGPLVVGSLEDLVYAAAVTHGAVFDIYGWNEGRSWIVVRPIDAAGPRTAQALLQTWVQAVEKPKSPGAARAAARALAASGWPAALEWLDARWRDRQDLAALDGLVLAAGRGALAASLASSRGAQVLLERADRALETSGVSSREAHETARALLSIGALGSEAWIGGFARASPRARALRCALVAAARSCPKELEELLEARLVAADTSGEERCALVRALGSLDETRAVQREIPGLELAFEWAVKHGTGRGFPFALRASGGREPESWKTARGLDSEAQSALCADALAQATEADAALAGARLAALLSQTHGEELALALLDRESLLLPAAQLRSGLLAARASGADAATITRLLVCAGLGLPDEGRAAADLVFASADWSDADWRVAGASIARAGGALDLWPRKEVKPDAYFAAFKQRLALVRDNLIAQAGAPGAPNAPSNSVGQRMDDGWVQGCERGLWLLRTRQSEPGAREFLRNLRVLFQRVQHPLRRELSAGRFPPPSPAVIVEVASREPWIGF